MRIQSLRMEAVSGLDLVEAAGLSDTVVLAGPNGVGKTRIMQALLGFFRNPHAGGAVRIRVEATSLAEEQAWGKRVLDTSSPDDCNRLRALLQRNQRRNNYRSTVLNFDSERAIIQVQPFSFSWDFADPFDEDIGWDHSLGFLRDRFNDVQHSLFKLVEGQRRRIADQALSLKASGGVSMPLDFPDPLERFKTAFGQLLAPKALAEVNVKTQTIWYESDGERRPLATLSSGEREVVNIAFDFLLRNPSDCVVFFDEPELHLHPELSYKLLQTLASIGKNNQFVFCTHSPEIITASIENSVVFVTPRKGAGKNQAILVHKDDATHHALHLLGQSIGIISLGKKLLLIEGDEASLDKQTYGAILKSDFSEFVLVPVGGKSTLRSFDQVRESVLNQTIWGVDFFMLCDRDAVLAMGEKSFKSHSSDRLAELPRYHLENYFLDEHVLKGVFDEIESDSSSWLRSDAAIRDELRRLAREAIPYAVALSVAAAVREQVGNVDVMPKGLDASVDTLVSAIAQRLKSERDRLSASLDVDALSRLCRTEFARLEAIVDDRSSEQWKYEIPGRVVLKRFASRAQLQVGRLKTLYLRKTQSVTPDPFAEIRAILARFRAVPAFESTSANLRT